MPPDRALMSSVILVEKTRCFSISRPLMLDTDSTPDSRNPVAEMVIVLEDGFGNIRRIVRRSGIRNPCLWYRTRSYPCRNLFPVISQHIMGSEFL